MVDPSAGEQPNITSLLPYFIMERKMYLPQQSKPDTDFWKGFFFGTMVGMVIATYSYVTTNFSFGKPQAYLESVKSFAQKPAA